MQLFELVLCYLQSVNQVVVVFSCIFIMSKLLQIIIIIRCLKFNFNSLKNLNLRIFMTSKLNDILWSKLNG